MIRGTTPTLQFELPFGVDLLSCLYVTLAQQGQVVVEKELNACECDGQTVTCKLTQADTLALNDKDYVEIQIRAKTTTGDVLASQIIPVRASRILKDGEI